MEPDRGRRPALLLALLVVLLGYAAYRARTGEIPVVERELYRAIEPPLTAASRSQQAISGRLTEVFRKEDLRAQVAQRDERLARLAQEIAGLEEARRENERLAALLELKARTPGSVRAARVVASEASGSLRSIVIDAGSRDGVAKDAAVLAPQGLVGRVLKVGTTTAVVQLLSDAAGGLGALDQRSRVQGVLVGSGREDCRLKYVPNLEDVRPGDPIVASGLDGIYPKGAIAGVVSEVSPGPDAFKDIRVRLAVPLDRLETVLVFVRREPSSPRATEGVAEARPAGRAALLRGRN